MPSKIAYFTLHFFLSLTVCFVMDALFFGLRVEAISTNITIAIVVATMSTLIFMRD